MDRQGSFKPRQKQLLAGFYYVLTAKKLHFMLLLLMESIKGGDDVVFGTASNDASPSKFIKMTASVVGTVFMLLPADTDCTLLLKGLSFTSTEAPDLVGYLLDGYMDTNFKLLAIPTIFPIPYISTAIKGELSNDSVDHALKNIADPTGPNWIQFISKRSKELADAVQASNMAKALLPALK